MTVREMADSLGLRVVSCEGNPSIDKVYCCDLLSVAMARAPEGAAWVTVIGNVNAVAVASLTEVACIILAEGFVYDAAAVEAAQGKRIALFQSTLPVYETAVAVGALL
jgi:hypothetical protein